MDSFRISLTILAGTRGIDGPENNKSTKAAFHVSKSINHKKAEGQSLLRFFQKCIFWR